MKKLADYLHTFYVYDCNTMLTWLEEALKENRELDLAGCKFGPRAAGMLTNYYATHTFINSEDEGLNRLLASNMARARRTESVNTVNLDLAQDTLAGCVEYFRSLDANKIYNAAYEGSSPIKGIALIVLLAMSRPEVKVIVNGLEGVVDFIRQYWLSKRTRHDAYFEFYGGSLIERKVQDGMVNVSGFGTFTENTYVLQFKCIPAEFGVKKITKSNLEYAAVQAAAIKIVSTKSKPPKSMRDFVTEGV